MHAFSLNYWGVAKWPKAAGFDLAIRRFESSHPSQPALYFICQSNIKYLQGLQTQF